TNGDKQTKNEKLSPEDQWLKNEQVQYMQVLRERQNKKRLAEIYDSVTAKKELKKTNIGNKSLRDLSINYDGRFISYRLYQSPSKRSATIVPNYITESGYTT